MSFQIVRDNIVHMKTDAIVNAANPELRAGGGVCGAIFEAAGHEELAKECARIGRCDVGSAVITRGYHLLAKYIIHAVGPVWQGGGQGEEALLAGCYLAALNLAKSRGLASIAFPLISSGIYGYPKDRALQIAVSAIGGFLLENDMTVYLVVYDRDAYQLSGKLFASIQSYIDDHSAAGRDGLAYLRAPEGDERPRREPLQRVESCASMAAPAALPKALPLSLQNALLQREDTFSMAVMRLIDERGLNDVDVYKRANLDRKLFSKLRSKKDYSPSKQTAIALSVALKLDLEETKGLLARAGYALSPCSRFDLIVSYFIRKGNYNIFEINQALFAFDEQLLGA